MSSKNDSFSIQIEYNTQFRWSHWLGQLHLIYNYIIFGRRWSYIAIEFAMRVYAAPAVFVWACDTSDEKKNVLFFFIISISIGWWMLFWCACERCLKINFHYMLNDGSSFHFVAFRFDRFLFIFAQHNYVLTYIYIFNRFLFLCHND